MPWHTLPARRRDARLSVGFAILAGVVAFLGAVQLTTTSSAASADGSSWASRADAGKAS